MAVSRSTLLKNLVIGFVAQGTELAKDILLVRFFGASAKSDAFLQAYMMISGVRNLLGEGPLSKIFVPMLARTGLKRIPLKTILPIVITATLVFSVAAWLLLSFSPILTFFSPQFGTLGSEAIFKGSISKMFFAVPALFVAAICAVILLSRQIYWQMPAGPFVFNAVVIGGIFIAGKLGLGWSFLAYSVVCAAILKLLFRVILLFGRFGEQAKETEVRLSQPLKSFLFQTTFWQGLSGVISRINYFFMLKFGAGLPAGQLTLLFFAHKVTDSFFHSTRVFFDNTTLVKASANPDKNLLPVILKTAAPVLSVTVVLCIIFSKTLVGLSTTLPDKIAFGALATGILAIWAAFGALARMQRNYFYATGLGHLATVQFVLEVFVNCGLSALFIYGLGMTGISLTVASLASAVLSFVLGFALWKRSPVAY